jgi:hypothetical protein
VPLNGGLFKELLRFRAPNTPPTQAQEKHAVENGVLNKRMVTVMAGVKNPNPLL